LLIKVLVPSSLPNRKNSVVWQMRYFGYPKIAK